MKRNGLEDIYGAKTSESFISDVIPDKLLPQWIFLRQETLIPA